MQSDGPYNKILTYSIIHLFFIQPDPSVTFNRHDDDSRHSLCPSVRPSVLCTWISARDGFKNQGRSHGLRQWFSTWLINPWFCNPSDSQSGFFRQPWLNSGGVTGLTAGFWTRRDPWDQCCSSFTRDANGPTEAWLETLRAHLGASDFISLPSRCSPCSTPIEAEVSSLPRSLSPSLPRSYFL